MARLQGMHSENPAHLRSSVPDFTDERTAKGALNAETSAASTLQNKLGDRPRANCYHQRSQHGPFSNPGLIDLKNGDQMQEVRAAVKTMLDDATKSGLSSTHKKRLHNMVLEYINVFRTLFSSSRMAHAAPLRLVSESGAAPVHVKLR